MPDITDQDRRAAREWADEMSGHPILNENARAAVRYVLATVDAPAPTLAEAMREWFDLHHMEHMDSFSALVDRAEQLWEWHEAEAEENETLTRERDEARKRATANLRAVDAVRAQRDEARAEVERLTAEQNTHTHTDNSVTDPADVKPGEAWLVRDEQELSVAVRDAERWVLIRLNDVTTRYRRIQHITLLHRLVPAPRVITNPDELDRLTATSTIRDGRGWPGGITDQGELMRMNGVVLDSTELLRRGPVTVLWEPEA